MLCSYSCIFILLFYFIFFYFSGQILHTDVVYLHGSGRNREADKLRHLMLKHRYCNSENESLFIFALLPILISAVRLKDTGLFTAISHLLIALPNLNQHVR